MACPNLLFAVPQCQSLPNDAPHLLREWGSRFPNVFSLTDGTPKGFGNFSDLHIQGCLVLDFGQQGPRNRQNENEGKRQANRHEHQDGVLMG